jgi:hypothetical protein
MVALTRAVHGDSLCGSVALRQLLLDALPLTDDIAAQQPLFAEFVQRSLLEAYIAQDPVRCAEYLSRARSLIELARELGHIDDTICAYVCRSIDSLLRRSRISSR